MSEDSRHERPGYMSPAAKIREITLRRIAARRGQRLERCRRRDPYAVGFGLYRLVDGNLPPGQGGSYTMTLDEVAAALDPEDRVRAA